MKMHKWWSREEEALGWPAAEAEAARSRFLCFRFYFLSIYTKVCKVFLRKVLDMCSFGWLIFFKKIASRKWGGGGGGVVGWQQASWSVGVGGKQVGELGVSEGRLARQAGDCCRRDRRRGTHHWHKKRGNRTQVGSTGWGFSSSSLNQSLVL